MKKNFSLLFALFACGSVFAAQATDEVVDETVVSEAAEPSAEALTPPNVETDWAATYSMAASQDGGHKTIEPFTDKGSHKGLDFSANVGTLIFTKGGSGAFVPEIGLGKRFNRNFYAGIGLGAEVPYSDGNTCAQFSADFNAYIPLKNSSIAPGGLLRVGYVSDFDYAKCVMISIMPTVQIPLSNKVDFNFGLGYSHFIYTGSNGSGYGAFAIRAGFDFHKSATRVKRPKVDTRDSGMQMTIEAYNMFGSSVGGALTFTYKYDPHWSFGIGAGYEYFVSEWGDSDEIPDSDYNPDTNFTTHYFVGTCSDLLNAKVYLRGVYRVLDKKFSPFASCDLGLSFRHIANGGDIYTSDWQWRHNDVDEEGIKKTGMYVSPAIGVSLRTTNNSYIELKVGYSLAPSLYKGVIRESDTSRYECVDKISMCKPYVSFGITHTFGWGEHWFGK